MLLAGPNGQGLISTGANLCAQMVAPYPPRGRISVASQSGNLVSSFCHYATMTGIGISKAISCGNSAQLTIDDYLEYFADDPTPRLHSSTSRACATGDASSTASAAIR